MQSDKSHRRREEAIDPVRYDIVIFMVRSWGALLGAGAVVLSLAVLERPGSAEPRSPAEIEEARRVFFEAVAAEDAGRYREALALYARARAVAVSAQLMFNAASCHERLDELTQAARGFAEALTEAHANGDAEVEREAQTMLDMLARDTPRLELILPGDAPRAAVVIDGASVSAGEIALDPGRHRISAADPNHLRVFDVELALARGDRRRIDVDLGPTRAVETPPAPARLTTPLAPAIVPPPASPPDRPRSYAPALAVAGAALAFTSVAVGTGIAGFVDRRRFDELNADPTADNRGEREDLRATGQRLYAASTVFVGAALVATGVSAYLFVRPPAGRAASHVRVEWTGASLRASW